MKSNPFVLIKNNLLIYSHLFINLNIGNNGVLGVLPGSLVVHSVRARRQEAVETVGVARAEVILQLCWPHR